MSVSGKVDPVVRPVAATDIAEALVEDVASLSAAGGAGVRSSPTAS
jgi:hypothetical protein